MTISIRRIAFGKKTKSPKEVRENTVIIKSKVIRKYNFFKNHETLINIYKYFIHSLTVKQVDKI